MSPGRDGYLPCGRLPRKGRARQHLSRTAAAAVRPDRPHPLFYGFVKASVKKIEAQEVTR